MGDFRTDIKEADKSIKLAGHILYVTYPLVKDNKLFIAVIERIDKSLKLAIDSLLFYERTHKRINPYPDNFNMKLDILRRSISMKYNLDKEIINFIMEINQIVKNRKESTIEFTRGEGLVICDASFRTRILKLEELKNYFLKAKVFISTVDNIITNEEI